LTCTECLGIQAMTGDRRHSNDVDSRRRLQANAGIVVTGMAVLDYRGTVGMAVACHSGCCVVAYCLLGYYAPMLCPISVVCLAVLLPSPSRFWVPANSVDGSHG